LIDLILLYPVVILVELLRSAVTQRKEFFALINLGVAQRLLRRMGIIRAYRVYNLARRTCPAYRKFLDEAGCPRLVFGQSLNILPQTNKENYVKKYSIEERCYGGRIPRHGVVIDESSGSSGTPNNWVRGPEDRADIKKLLQFSFAFTYRDKDLFLINCFALGPWATGMNVSMSLVDTAILKSIGPDVQKLENTLRIFGPQYKYLIAGYPPFIKLFLDQTALDLSPYELHLVTGGEGMSAGLRAHFEKTFKSVISSYGASDLDINIGAETEFTIQLGRLAQKDPELAKRLFGQTRVPMIFQYNPMDFYVEVAPTGELIYTVNRRRSAAPKVRYDLKDLGGVLAFREVAAALRESGMKPQALAARLSCLPLLFVYGRGDLAVPFYGAKVLTSDIDSVINNTPILADAFYSFRLSVFEDESLAHFLKLTLQRRRSASAVEFTHQQTEEFRSLFFDELKALNQDFREVSKMFTREKLVLDIHGFQEGPFHGEDIRVKLNYLQQKGPA
jgi:phenylacetate-CoA ligase